jgi:hypothetical protein
MRSAVPPGTFGKVKGFSAISPVVAHPVKIPARVPPETFKNSLLDMAISLPLFPSLSVTVFFCPFFHRAEKEEGKRTSISLFPYQRSCGISTFI